MTTPTNNSEVSVKVANHIEAEWVADKLNDAFKSARFSARGDEVVTTGMSKSELGSMIAAALE